MLYLLIMKKIAKKITQELSYATGRYLTPPEFLSLIVTWRCNFRCQMCSIWQKDTADELNLDNWLKIAADLKNNLPQKTFVEINGGEPLLRRDLVVPLIKELKYFQTVALNSNGLLITPEIISELENANLDILKISFYSLDKDVHNALRGMPDAYDHALNAIKLISQSKIKLEVGLLITNQNIASAPELIKYLSGLPNTKIILQPLDESVESTESKNRRQNQLPAKLWPTPEQATKFFDWVLNDHRSIKNSPANIQAIKEYYLQPKNVLRYRCFAGQRNAVIYPNGDVALCFKGSVVGNITKQNLKEILKKATNERKFIKTCPKYCRIIGCNFSRGLREIITSSLKGV
ncbi:MAG: radical SAM protein [Patescibacteria group bacterium]